MSDDLPPYWRLISILFSSFPLTPQLATRLYRTAFDLYRSDGGVADLRGDSDVILSGEMRNLKQELTLGTFAGPAFEAHVDTERGSGTVRFLVTHEGIELLSEGSAASRN